MTQTESRHLSHNHGRRHPHCPRRGPRDPGDGGPLRREVQVRLPQPWPHQHNLPGDGDKEDLYQERPAKVSQHYIYLF